MRIKPRQRDEYQAQSEETETDTQFSFSHRLHVLDYNNCDKKVKCDCPLTFLPINDAFVNMRLRQPQNKNSLCGYDLFEEIL